jgi:hypothetical protein
LAPYLAHTASISNDVLPYLGTFYCGSILALTFYGGVFSALPAYIADLFGQKHAGAIHGKLLTAWAASAIVGPMGLGYMRSYSISNAIEDLLNKIEVSDSSISSGSSAAAATTTKFEQTFGCTIQDTDTIQRLIDAKTITIGRLIELMPEGTVDPTPFIYDTTCYAAAGLMGIGLLANLAIRPLDYVKIVDELNNNNKI